MWAEAVRALLGAGVALGMLALPASGIMAQAADPRPNIVVVLTDDLDVGSYELALAHGMLPNLEAHLVGQGTSFSNSFVTNSLCCPSRATLLTGQYSHNHGVLTNAAPLGGVAALDDTSTVATWLQDGGYRTGFVGKYLNGYGQGLTSHPAHGPTYVPPGWSDWQALVGLSTYRVYDYTVNDNGWLVHHRSQPGDYQTDVLSRRAVSFIRESNGPAHAGMPFFLLISTLAPHGETAQGELCVVAGAGMSTIRSAPRHAGLAASITLPQPPSFNEADVSDKPRWLKHQMPLLDTPLIGCLEQVYRDRLDSLRAVDDLVGAVVDELAQSGELDNTAIIFTSDNGYLFGEHRLAHKTFAYEEAIRVPLVARVPGVAGPRVETRFVLNNDLAPTVADLAQITPGIAVDGRSVLPLLRDMAPPVWRQQFLVEHWLDSGMVGVPTYAGLRSSNEQTEGPDRLYVRYEDGSHEFYNLGSDPYQLDSRYDALSSGARQHVHRLLGYFQACQGDDCAALESDSSHVPSAAQRLAAAAGPGNAPHVEILDVRRPVSGVIESFLAYDAGFRGGVFVAQGDVTGEASADVITGADAGWWPHVKVFDHADGSLLRSFLAYDAGFRGGVRVAAGDVTGDGRADIVTGAGPGGGPHVRVFDAVTGAQVPGFVGSFFAYGWNYTGGIYVAAGDVTGDGRADLAVGTGGGISPEVRVFDGVTGALLRSILPYPGFGGAVRVALGDVTGDGRADIVTGAGPGGGPHVRVFDGVTGAQIPGPLGSFFAYAATHLGGIYVAAADVNADGHADVIVGAQGSLPVQVFDGRTGATLRSFRPFGASYLGEARVAGSPR